LSSVVTHKAILDSALFQKYAVSAYLIRGDIVLPMEFDLLNSLTHSDGDHIMVLFASHENVRLWSEEVAEKGYQDLLKTKQWTCGKAELFLVLSIDHIGLSAMTVVHRAHNKDQLRKSLKLYEATLGRNQIIEKIGISQVNEIKKQFHTLVADRLRDLGRSDIASNLKD